MNDFELDKTRFGQFLAEERKRKELTQKELAQRLYVSDKAVSKWERGLSLPDVALLIPLAKELGVTVTELLEGQPLDAASDMRMAEVEHLVKKTLNFSTEVPEQGRVKRGRSFFLWLACIPGVLGEYAAIICIDREVLIMHHFHSGSSLIMTFLTAIFAAWFWLGAKERLPAYYDENKISIYADGIFRMSVPGLYFNNRNWPHILRWIQLWSLTAMAAAPALFTALEFVTGPTIVEGIMLALLLGSLFFPPYLIGRKYQ